MAEARYNHIQTRESIVSETNQIRQISTGSATHAPTHIGILPGSMAVGEGNNDVPNNNATVDVDDAVGYDEMSQPNEIARRVSAQPCDAIGAETQRDMPDRYDDTVYVHPADSWDMPDDGSFDYPDHGENQCDSRPGNRMKIRNLHDGAVPETNPAFSDGLEVGTPGGARADIREKMVTFARLLRNPDGQTTMPVPDV